MKAAIGFFHTLTCCMVFFLMQAVSDAREVGRGEISKILEAVLTKQETPIHYRNVKLPDAWIHIHGLLRSALYQAAGGSVSFSVKDVEDFRLFAFDEDKVISYQSDKVSLANVLSCLAVQGDCVVILTPKGFVVVPAFVHLCLDDYKKIRKGVFISNQ